MSLAAAWFRLRSKKSLLLLEGRVEVCRVGRRTPTDFYCLGKDLEAYRDLVRDHLDTLPVDERTAVEAELWPAVKALVDKIEKLTNEAHKAKIIDESMVYDLGMLGISLLVVVAFTKIMVDPRVRILTRGGVEPRH